MPKANVRRVGTGKPGPIAVTHENPNMRAWASFENARFRKRGYASITGFANACRRRRTTLAELRTKVS